MNAPETAASTAMVLFSLSFLTALTGAMAPGPLLTYTIIQSAKTRTRGYMMGFWIILGHALLEVFIVAVILGGFSFVLQKASVLRFIGVIGGGILIYFGSTIIRDVLRGDISVDFATSGPDDINDQALNFEKRRWIENPIAGGVFISMSNPYWWIWWVTIGVAFMAEFNVSFSDWPNLIAFLAGHEAGDFAWYLAVSVFSYFGVRKLNKRMYYAILACCGVFMVLFGLYLGVSPLFKTADSLLNSAG